MNIREALEQEVIDFFRARGRAMSPSTLSAASRSIDFDAIEAVIRSEIENHMRLHPFRRRELLEVEARRIYERHERLLRQLARIYAERIFRVVQTKSFLTASDAAVAQLAMKRARPPGCDVYPCQK